METISTMRLRIKQVCKAKGLNMNELAKMLSINPVSLSSAINGNPTVGWLEKVADVLGVEVAVLIERMVPLVVVCVMVGSEVYTIKCKEDLMALADKVSRL